MVVPANAHELFATLDHSERAMITDEIATLDRAHTFGLREICPPVPGPITWLAQMEAGFAAIDVILATAASRWSHPRGFPYSNTQCIFTVNIFPV